jgi:hypothetical protein
MKRTYYVVLWLNREILIDGIKHSLPKGKGFLPVFDSKEDAEAAAPPFVEIIEIESRDEVEG